MNQNLNYLSGDAVFSEISVVAPATGPLTMRTRSKNTVWDFEFPCLSPGGKIKATAPETLHVDSVDPEPGVGYGWYHISRDN